MIDAEPVRVDAEASVDDLISDPEFDEMIDDDEDDTIIASPADAAFGA